MRQCAGLPPQPPLRRDNPRVLFINRRHNGAPQALTHTAAKLQQVAEVFSHAAGRSVLAMAEAYNYLKVNGAEHEHVVAKLTYMEGLSLAQQVIGPVPCRESARCTRSLAAFSNSLLQCRQS